MQKIEGLIKNVRNKEIKYHWFGRSCKLRKMADQIMDPKGEPMTITVLNQYNSQLHSKYRSLYLLITVSLIPHQRRFLCSRDPYRNLQLVKIQSVVSILNCYFYDIILIHHRRWGQKECKRQRTRMSATR